MRIVIFDLDGTITDPAEGIIGDRKFLSRKRALPNDVARDRRVRGTLPQQRQFIHASPLETVQILS